MFKPIRAKTYVFCALAMLAPLLAARGDSSGDPDCGDGLWFKGVRGEAGFTMTAASFDASQDIMYLGGSTNNALALSIDLERITGNDAAVVMIVEQDKELDMTFVIDKVTHATLGDIPVTGIQALTSDRKAAWGVMQTTSQNLILFEIEKPQRGNKIVFTMIPGYETGYDCGLDSNSIYKDEDTDFIFTFTQCSSTEFAFIGKAEGDLGKVTLKEFELDDVDFTYASGSNEKSLLGAYSSDREEIYLVLFDGDTEICSYRDQMSVDQFGAIMTPLGHFLSATGVIHGVLPGPGGAVYLKALYKSSSLLACPDSASFRIIEDSSRSFEVQQFSVRAVTGEQDMLLRDTLSGDYLLFLGMFTEQLGDLPQPQQVIFTKSISTFSYDADIFKVLVGVDPDGVMVRAAGSTGFVVSDGYTSSDSCMQMTLQNDSNSANFYVADSLDGYLDMAIIDSKSEGYVSSVVLTEVDLTSVLDSDATSAAEMKETKALWGVTNPCQITVNANLPDITRLVTDLVSTVTDGTATAYPTCPTNLPYTDHFIEVVDVLDSNGASVSPIADYVYITEDNELNSLVTDHAKAGTYTVQYIAGHISETQYELSDNPILTMSLTVLSDKCTSVLGATAIQPSYDYNIGDTAFFVPLDATVGDCSYSVSVTATPSLPAGALTVNQGSFTNPDLTLPDIYSTSAYADVSFFTSDNSLAGSYTLVIDYTDSSDLGATDQLTTVINFESNFCVSVLSPLALQASYEYMVGQPELVIPLQATVGFCTYQVSLTAVPDYNAWLGPSGSTSLSYMTVNQATFVNPDPSIFWEYLVMTYADVRFYTTDEADAGNTYVLYIDYTDSSDPGATAQLTTQVTISKTPCTSVLTATALQASYNYQIGQAELVIPLLATVGDCTYSVSVTAAPALDPTITTVNQGTFTNPDPNMSLLFSTVTSADVRFQSSDLSLGGTSYTLTVDYSDSALVAGTDQLTTTLNLIDPCVTTGLAGQPSNGDWDMTYVIGSTAKTIPFPGFSNGNCHFASTVTLPSQLTPTDLASFGLTFNSESLLHDQATLTYSVTSDGFLTVQSTDESLDGLSLTVNVQVDSNINPSDTGFITFTFTITYQVIRCSPSIVLDTTGIQSEYLYAIGDPALSITFDGASNNNCEFNLQVLDVATNIIIESVSTAFTKTDPTFFVNDPELPNYKTIGSHGLLQVYETNTSNEASYDLKVIVISNEQGVITSAENTFKVTLYKPNACTQGFRNVPTEIAESTYQIKPEGTAPLVIEFPGLDNTECIFEVTMSDTTYGTNFVHTAFTLTSPQLVQSATSSDPNILQVTTYPSITVYTTDISLWNQSFTVSIRLTSTRNILDSVTQDFALVINLLPACDVLLPAQDSFATVTVPFLVNYDQEKVVQVSGEEFDFQTYCSEHTTFSITMFPEEFNGELIVPALPDIFSVYKSEGNPSAFAQLTIESFDRADVGTYLLLVTETSDLDASVSYTTQITVEIEDFCLSATLTTLNPLQTLDYKAGDPLVQLDLGALQTEFTIDPDHVDKCSQIEFTYSAVLQSGELDLQNTVQIDTDAEQMSFSTVSGQKNATFAFIVAGSVMGDVDYAQLELWTMVTIIEKIIPPAVNITVADTTDQVPVAEEEEPAPFVIDAKNYTITETIVEPPEFEILSLNATGMLTIYVTLPLQIPKWPALDGQSQADALREVKLEDYLNLQLHSSTYEDDAAEMSINSYHFEKFTSQFLQISIDFEQPNLVSFDSSELETLELQVISNSIFISSTSGTPVSNSTVLETEVVPQITLDQELAAQELEAAVVSVLTAVGWSNLALQLLIAYGLKYLWNIVNIMQFAVYLPRWSLSYPQNVKSFLAAVKVIALMEFLPTDWLTDGLSDLFDMSECDGSDDADCDYYEELHIAQDEQIATKEAERRRQRRLQQESLLESSPSDSDAVSDEDEQEEEAPRNAVIKGPNIVKQIGVFAGIFLLMLIFVGLLFCFRCCAMTNYSVFKFYMTIKGKLFYNVFIRYTLQSFLKLFIGACTTLTIIDWSQGGGSQGAISILMCTIFVLLPLFYAYVMYRNRVHLALPSKRQKIGTLYMNMDTDKISALSYSIVFLVRRILFVTITFALVDYPHFQIQGFMFCSLLYICYLTYSPLYEQRSMGKLEAFNEMIFLVCCYHLVLFANLVNDYEAREQIGTSFMIVAGLMVLVNMMFVFGASITGCYNSCRIRCLKKKQKRMIKERRDQFLAKQESIQAKARLKREEKAQRKAERQQLKDLAEQQELKTKAIFGIPAENKIQIKAIGGTDTPQEQIPFDVREIYPEAADIIDRRVQQNKALYFDLDLQPQLLEQSYQPNKNRYAGAEVKMIGDGKADTAPVYDFDFIYKDRHLLDPPAAYDNGPQAALATAGQEDAKSLATLQSKDSASPFISSIGSIASLKEQFQQQPNQSSSDQRTNTVALADDKGSRSDQFGRMHSMPQLLDRAQPQKLNQSRHVSRNSHLDHFQVERMPHPNQPRMIVERTFEITKPQQIDLFGPVHDAPRGDYFTQPPSIPAKVFKSRDVYTLSNQR